MDCAAVRRDRGLPRASLPPRTASYRRRSRGQRGLVRPPLARTANLGPATIRTYREAVDHVCVISPSRTCRVTLLPFSREHVDGFRHRPGRSPAAGDRDLISASSSVWTSQPPQSSSTSGSLAGPGRPDLRVDDSILRWHLGAPPDPPGTRHDRRAKTASPISGA